MHPTYCILLYIAVYPHYKCCIGEPMATGKTTTLTFRIEPALKEGLRAAAVQEHRPIANRITVMIRASLKPVKRAK